MDGELYRGCTGRFATLLAAALALACSGGGGRTALPGVQPLEGKVILRRGGELQTDVERFLASRYVLIGSEGFEGSGMGEVANEARAAGKRAGAHLVTLYVAAPPEAVAALKPPVTIPEPGLGVRPGAVLAGVRPAGVLALFWARPTRPTGFGAYVYAEEDASVPDKGVRIAFVVRASPALVGGLQPGDRVVRVDGEAPMSAADFLARVEAARGELPVLEVVRDGESQKFEIDVAP